MMKENRMRNKKQLKNLLDQRQRISETEAALSDERDRLLQYKAERECGESDNDFLTKIIKATIRNDDPFWNPYA